MRAFIALSLLACAAALSADVTDDVYNQWYGEPVPLPPPHHMTAHFNADVSLRVRLLPSHALSSACLHSHSVIMCVCV